MPNESGTGSIVTVRLVNCISSVCPLRSTRRPRWMPASAAPSRSVNVVVPSASDCVSGTKPLPWSTAMASSPRCRPAVAAGLPSNTSRIEWPIAGVGARAETEADELAFAEQ